MCSFLISFVINLQIFFFKFQKTFFSALVPMKASRKIFLFNIFKAIFNFNFHKKAAHGTSAVAISILFLQINLFFNSKNCIIEKNSFYYENKENFNCY